MREQTRLLGRSFNERSQEHNASRYLGPPKFANDEPTLASDEQQGECANQLVCISVGGIAFRSPQPFTPNQQANLCFQLEGHAGRFLTRARVLRTQSTNSTTRGSQLVAAQFNALDPWDERRLQRILHYEQKLNA